MSHRLSTCILLLLVITTGALGFGWKTKSQKDLDPVLKSARCGVCTITLDLSIQYLALHPEPVNDFVQKHLCELFSEPAINYLCKQAVSLFGDMVIQMILNQAGSDDICQTLMLCEDTTCRLRPKNHTYPSMTVSSNYKPMDSVPRDLNFDPWEFLRELYEHLSVQHLPLIDGDGDRFSTYPTLRGYYWRGKDCNDFNANIYPGRKIPLSPDSDTDHDCNGIYGTDPTTNRTWEDLLCANITRYGIGIIGDSVGAHFSIPGEYLNASKINSTTYNNVLANLMNEFDLPHFSAATGFMNSTEEAPVSSLYKFFRERNRCNHRDYQNVAVNGGDTNDTDVNMKALIRNQTFDHPMIVVHEIIGNDVCFGPGKMTPPEMFKQGVLERLEFLDTILPPGSHVLMFGLVNGSMLYDFLHDEKHPIGITYRNMYDFLNCLELNPCPGWLNSDAETRRLTTEGAFAINAKYREIIAEGRVYKNFDYAYYEFPVVEIMSKWVADGGKATDLIEPIDGFHSNQKFNALIADWVWQRLNEDHPDWIGDINPNNNRIIELFGDQGGHL